MPACPTGARSVRTAVESDNTAYGRADTQTGDACPEDAPGGVLMYDRTLCIGCGACAAACPAGACELSAQPMTTEEIVRLVLRDSTFYAGRGGVTLSGGEPLMHPG